MDDGRTSKRARKACINCRRKKTRCSGEMPVCAFCARLNQSCVWDSERHHTLSSNNLDFGTPDSALAARVALLESKLSLFGADTVYNASTSTSSNSFVQPTTGTQPSDTEAGPAQINTTASFSTLPEPAVMAELIDAYFTHCHNQPYSYFHEATFRQRFEEDALPVSLLFAVAATGCRFADSPQYSQLRQLAIASYASSSWTQIFQQSFSYEEDLDISLVQAISMLAVIDFTAGHPRHGWVKLALSVRFAQALRLNEEPDPELPLWEREERRRTFWSMYLLDRLISIGPNRPPAFADGDCTVHLPSSDASFINGIDFPHMPTLEDVFDDPKAQHYRGLDHFAMTILMAYTLGHFIRFSSKRASLGTNAPWDSRSAYYGIHSMLLQFESHSPLTYATLSVVLQTHCTAGAIINKQLAGHLVFSQALFHVNQCLLNHPLVLYRLFQRCSAPVPPSFAREALQRSHSHAAELLDLVREAQQCGRLAESSFYGYCAVLTGVIFRLYELHPDELIASIARGNVKTALEYLEREPARWDSHLHKARVLRGFSPTAEMARALTDPTQLAQKTRIDSNELLWSLIDYASLQGASRRRTSFAPSASASLTHASHHVRQPGPGPEVTMINPETVPTPIPAFQENLGLYQANDLEMYLGNDMGGIWAQVFSSQGSAGHPWNGAAPMGSDCD